MQTRNYRCSWFQQRLVAAIIVVCGFSSDLVSVPFHSGNMFDDFLQGLASPNSEDDHGDALEPAEAAVPRRRVAHNRFGIYHTKHAKTKMMLGRAKLELAKSKNVAKQLAEACKPNFKKHVADVAFGGKPAENTKKCLLASGGIVEVHLANNGNSTYDAQTC
jgi:hypothetical protein